MRITVDLNDIESAINQVEQYQKDIEIKKQKLIEQLAYICGKEARVSFTNAMYSGDNDVEVSVEPIENGYKVVASGNAVMFIEFGTGKTNPDNHPWKSKVGGLSAHGKYGKGKGSNPKGWVYKGEQGNAGQQVRDGVYRTRGNPPSRSMYNASKITRQEIERVAKEVFG